MRGGRGNKLQVDKVHEYYEEKSLNLRYHRCRDLKVCFDPGNAAKFYCETANVDLVDMILTGYALVC